MKKKSPKHTKGLFDKLTNDEKTTAIAHSLSIITMMAISLEEGYMTDDEIARELKIVQSIIFEIIRKDYETYFDSVDFNDDGKIKVFNKLMSNRRKFVDKFLD